jgi:hypothetical protein
LIVTNRQHDIIIAKLFPDLRNYYTLFQNKETATSIVRASSLTPQTDLPSWLTAAARLLLRVWADEFST